MNWILIVCRSNTIEQVKVFKDYWEAATFADNLIKRVEPGCTYLPAYNCGEIYTNNDLYIGIYQE